VTRTEGGREVWRDNLTGLIWSDIVSWGATWCEASGSNNKLGSPYGEVDPVGLCSGLSQNQKDPISVCTEDETYLNGIAPLPYKIDYASKGGLGKLRGATTPLTWWLPYPGDFDVAYEHGSAKILPNLSNSLWTRSNDGNWAWAFDAFGERFWSRARQYGAAVRCVGR